MTSYDFLVFIRAQTNRRAAMLKHRNLRKVCAFAYVCLFLGHLGSSGILWGPSGVPLKSYGFWRNSVVPLGYLWGSSGVHLGYLWDPYGAPMGSICCRLVSLCCPSVVLMVFFCCSSCVLLKSVLAKSLQSLISIHWYPLGRPKASYALSIQKVNNIACILYFWFGKGNVRKKS